MRIARVLLAVVLLLPVAGCERGPFGLFSQPWCIETHGPQSLEAIRKAIEPKVVAGGDFYGLGGGQNSVEVHLVPGRYDFGSRLKDCYGDLVNVTVGFTHVPPGGQLGRSRDCGSLRATDQLPPGVTARIDMSKFKLRMFLHGLDETEAELVLAYHGPDSFEAETGRPVYAALVRRGTLQVVGSYAGVRDGVGWSVVLHDGQSDTIPLVLGSSRCDGGPGSAIPSGTYGVRAEFLGAHYPKRYISDEGLITIR
jgi:hypothetical protein